MKHVVGSIEKWSICVRIWYETELQSSKDENLEIMFWEIVSLSEYEWGWFSDVLCAEGIFEKYIFIEKWVTGKQHKHEHDHTTTITTTTTTTTTSRRPHDQDEEEEEKDE